MSTTESNGNNNISFSIINSKQGSSRRRRNRKDLNTTSLTNLHQQQYDASAEDIIPPNFDEELQRLKNEVKNFIEIFQGEVDDTISLIEIIKNASEIGKLFGAETTNYLISFLCMSSINKHDSKVTVQVLKTLSSLCLIIGQNRVDTKILPMIEDLFSDPEDLVIIESIKLHNLFVQNRLVNQ